MKKSQPTQATQSKVSIRKKTADDTCAELIKELSKFCTLLKAQDEDEAVTLLQKLQKILMKVEKNDPKMLEALQALVDAFDGDLELRSYTLTSKKSKTVDAWTEADELFLISSSVWNLTQRLLKAC